VAAVFWLILVVELPSIGSKLITQVYKSLTLTSCLLGLGDGHTGLDLTGHHDEGLLDVLAVLGGCLQEAHVVVLGELLALVGGDLAGVGHVALVADEDARDVVGGVLLDLVHPVLNRGEALAVSDVVGHDDAVRPLVVGRRDRLESLLARGVPDLKLDGLAVNLDGADLEVHADGWHEVICEDIVCESEQERGLADSGVTDEQHLEQVVTIDSIICARTYYSGFIFERL
jgi:hypothetical protein